MRARDSAPWPVSMEVRGRKKEIREYVSRDESPLQEFPYSICVCHPPDRESKEGRCLQYSSLYARVLPMAKDVSAEREKGDVQKGR
jgi:hypothetical protein